MLTTINDIELTLSTLLATLSDNVNIAWPNTEYTPTYNNTWLRPTHIPAKIGSGTLDGGQCYTGIYQIDVFIPLNIGQDYLLDLLQDIQTLYLTNRALTRNNTIVYIQSAGFGAFTRKEAWYSSFIEINYICYD